MALIPLNQPFLDSSEADAVRRVLDSGHIHGNGPVTQRVESQLRE